MVTDTVRVSCTMENNPKVMATPQIIRLVSQQQEQGFSSSGDDVSQQYLVTSLLSRTIGSTTCTRAFGRVPKQVQPAATALVEVPSLLKVLVLPWLPYKITFFVNTDVPVTVTGVLLAVS